VTGFVASMETTRQRVSSRSAARQVLNVSGGVITRYIVKLMTAGVVSAVKTRQRGHFSSVWHLSVKHDYTRDPENKAEHKSVEINSMITRLRQQAHLRGEMQN